MMSGEKTMNWFTGEMRVAVNLRQLDWLCPQNGCDGKMIYSGKDWLTDPVGYQHICDKCGFGGAICVTFPGML